MNRVSRRGTARHAVTGGFTMLEMMVVVAIVGILAAIAVVNLTTLSATAKVNGEASTIAQMIRVARMQAISTGCAHVFRFRGPDFSGAEPGTITVYRKATAACTVNTVVPVPTELVFASGDLVVNVYQLNPNIVVTVGGVDLHDKSVELAFNANGTNTAGENGVAWTLAPFVVTSAQVDSRYTRTVAFLGGNNVSLQ